MKRTVLTLSLLAGLAITACQKELDQAPPTGQGQQSSSDLRSDRLPSHLPTAGAIPGELSEPSMPGVVPLCRHSPLSSPLRYRD